jgi:hypothetical protein
LYFLKQAGLNIVQIRLAPAFVPAFMADGDMFFGPSFFKGADNIRAVILFFYSGLGHFFPAMAPLGFCNGCCFNWLMTITHRIAMQHGMSGKLF